MLYWRIFFRSRSPKRRADSNDRRRSQSSKRRRSRSDDRRRSRSNDRRRSRSNDRRRSRSNDRRRSRERRLSRDRRQPPYRRAPRRRPSPIRRRLERRPSRDRRRSRSNRRSRSGDRRRRSRNGRSSSSDSSSSDRGASRHKNSTTHIDPWQRKPRWDSQLLTSYRRGQGDSPKPCLQYPSILRAYPECEVFECFVNRCTCRWGIPILIESELSQFYDICLEAIPVCESVIARIIEFNRSLLQPVSSRSILFLGVLVYIW